MVQRDYFKWQLDYFAWFALQRKSSEIRSVISPGIEENAELVDVLGTMEHDAGDRHIFSLEWKSIVGMDYQSANKSSKTTVASKEPLYSPYFSPLVVSKTL